MIPDYWKYKALNENSVNASPKRSFAESDLVAEQNSSEEVLSDNTEPAENSFSETVAVFSTETSENYSNEPVLVSSDTAEESSETGDEPDVSPETVSEPLESATDLSESAPEADDAEKAVEETSESQDLRNETAVDNNSIGAAEPIVFKLGSNPEEKSEEEQLDQSIGILVPEDDYLDSGEVVRSYKTTELSEDIIALTDFYASDDYGKKNQNSSGNKLSAAEERRKQREENKLAREKQRASDARVRAGVKAAKEEKRAAEQKEAEDRKSAKQKAIDEKLAADQKAAEDKNAAKQKAAEERMAEKQKAKEDKLAARQKAKEAKKNKHASESESEVNEPATTDYFSSSESDSKSGDKKSSKGAGRVLRIIFLDILLGIPFVIICFVLFTIGFIISCLLGLFSFILCVASLSGGVFALIEGFGNISVQLPFALLCFGGGLALLGLGALFMLLGLLICRKLIPAAGRTYSVLLKKLKLFR